MQLIINVRIPQEVVRELSVYRKKYHPTGLSHSPAHITLIPPFILRGKLSELIKDTRAQIDGIKSFNINLDGFGSFDDKVIFVKPNCPAELKKLHAVLKKLVQEKYRKRGREKYWGFPKYNPHVTISKNRADKIKRLKKEIRKLEYKRTFGVDGVNLYVLHKNKRWTFKKAFLFNK